MKIYTQIEKINMKRVLILIFVSLFFSSAIAQKEKIELNLIKGKTYNYNMNSSSSIFTTSNKQTIRTSSINNSKISCKVIDIHDSIYEMEVKYDTLFMTVNMNNIAMEFSSFKNNVNDVMSIILSEITNKPFTIKITKSGRIKEITHTDFLFTTLFDKLPQLNETKKKQIKTQMVNAYGENGSKANFDIIFSIFPGFPVSKGANWSAIKQVENEIKLKTVCDYTLIEVTDSYFHIIGESKIKPNSDDEITDYSGMPSHVKMAGIKTYDIKIDKKSGWIISSAVGLTLKGTVSVIDGPSMPGGMEMQMNVMGFVNISNKEIDSKYQPRIRYANNFIWTYNKGFIPVAVQSRDQLSKMMYLRIEFDENNKPIQINYMQDGISLPMFFFGDDIFSIIFEYDHRKMKQTYLNKNGMPANNIDGYSKIITKFDANGDKLSEYYLDKNDQPTKDEFGYYKYLYYKGTVDYYSTCLDLKDSLILSNEACEVHYQLDNKGVIIKNTWLDKNKKVTLNEHNYAKSELTYNEDYTLKEIKFLNLNDSLCIAKNRGCAKLVFEYDIFGQQTTIKYFGTDEKLILNPKCNCSIIRGLYTSDGKFDKTILYDQFDKEIKNK